MTAEETDPESKKKREAAIKEGYGIARGRPAPGKRWTTR